MWAVAFPTSLGGTDKRHVKRQAEPGGDCHRKASAEPHEFGRAAICDDLRVRLAWHRGHHYV